MTVTDRKTSRHMETPEPRLIEWMTGLVSVLLVVALLGLIGSEALNASDELPDLTVTVQRVEQRGEYFLVQIDLSNRARTTAAAVRVEGRLTLPDGTTEEAEATFDYAPAQSSTTGGLIFRTDPAKGALAVQPSGYTEP